MNLIKMVIFDMAGTTINEDNLVYKTIHQTLMHHEYGISLDEVLLEAAGKEKWQAFFDLIKSTTITDPPKAIVDRLHKEFVKRLEKSYYTSDITLFESVPDIISYLRSQSIKVVFNTGYNRMIAEYLLKKVGIIVGDQIDLLVTANDVDFSRPYPDMIDIACLKLATLPQHCIKVGDSVTDILEGHNAHVKYSIGITTGAQNADQLAKGHPHYIIDNLIELKSIINPLTN